MIFNYHFIIKVIIAAFLGALIGLERKTKFYGIGIRTASLISISSCIFTLAGMAFFDESNISRIVQGLAAGIGFIGAAVIWRQNQDHAWIYGLTTAVIVWFLTAIGILVALSFYLEALLITILVLIILLLKKLGVE
ncbi:MAG: MgtC/SapB family protein [Candidatus Pacearchaeota archaeon]